MKFIIDAHLPKSVKLKEVTALFTEIAPKLIDLLQQHDLLEVHRDKIIAIV